MSYSQMYEVVCDCGEHFEAELWDSINPTTDPDLKEDILNGEINVVSCPVCRLMFYVEKLVIYHDMERSLIVYVCPLSWEKDADTVTEKFQKDFVTAMEEVRETERAKYKLHILFGMDALVELIRSQEEDTKGI